MSKSSVLDLFKLDGKTALVTGANGGIGSGMSLGLAEAGADIIIIQIPGDKSEFHKQITALGRKVSVYDCDLSKTSEIKSLVERVLQDGHEIDILVNSAGVSGHTPIIDVSDEFRERVVAINMTAPYVLTQAIGKHMIARGKGGKVLNVSSMAGTIASKNISVYAGTKGAVNSFTSAFANEFAEHHIQVNCVCPGYILTPLTEAHYQREGFRNSVLARTPAGRWGVPGDFKGLTVFFCSAASDYLTGVWMPVDGGMHGT